MPFDCVIRGGLVVDGSGKIPTFRSDVAITDGKIVALDDLVTAEAATYCDASGHIICPGFIDALPWQSPPEESDSILQETAPHPRVMIASDGVYEFSHPHPRSYGCYAQVLRKFVRELNVMSMEEAVCKMSGFPAQRFGLNDRGRIEVGAAADLVVFDPEIIADRSTWLEPLQPAVGVKSVMVNGTWVIENGRPTGALPGRVLRRAA